MAWANCKHCGEKIVWAQMPAGQWLPMDPDIGGKHECLAPTRAPAGRSVWRYHDDDFCRPTSCPVCGDEVFFVRHNGGSVWFDELGPPWPKHACFDDEPVVRRLRRDLRSQVRRGNAAVFGVVIETVATRPGKGGRIVVRCSDGTIVDSEFDTEWDLVALVGQLVRVDRRDGKVTLVRIDPPLPPPIPPLPPPPRK